jgi:hypothetical protein
MRYIKVRWNHSFPNEPVILYSELDSKGFEVRKVEVFRDGLIDYASRYEHGRFCRLGEEAVPSLEEIAADSQFEPMEIGHEEFEVMWARRKGRE